MQIKQETLTPTSIKLTITAEASELAKGKKIALEHLGEHSKLPGFREGKAPASVVEKSVDPNRLQSEFLNETVNLVYPGALAKNNLRVVKEPEITITKFVPFTELEFTATVDVVGDIKLADYKKIKLTPEKASVTAKDVDQVLSNLAERSAERTEAKRPAKNGDDVELDFHGVDAKTKQSIAGADGKNYNLVLGSKTFIPGFEEEVLGLKAGDTKSFDIVFPEDYGSKELQKKKVTFEIKIHKVSELKPPKIDDKFAASVGPFKTVVELKADIKKQLTQEKQTELDQKFENELMQKIADKTEVAIPDSLIEQEVDRLEDDEKRNLVYRGQTWQEHLEQEGLSQEEHRAKERPFAELRVKTGLILGAVADKEKIDVSDDELELRLNLLKGQYPDPSMQAELSSKDGKRDIQSRMMVEKTLDFLKKSASSAK